MNRSTLFGSLLIALFLTAAGCEKGSKSDSNAQPEAAKAQPAAAVMTTGSHTEGAKAEAVAESADEKNSCAGKEHSGGDCGNMAEEEGGGCNQWDEAAGKVIERDVPENATWTTLKVTGMTCGGCERRVIAKVGALDGVYSVEADAELGQVRVAMDSSKPKLAAQAAETINNLGYRVQ